MARHDRRNHYSREQDLRAKAEARTREAIRQQNALFAQAHKEEDDEQLLQYVRNLAKALERTPDVGEVIGGTYIAERFGGWAKVLDAAELPASAVIPKLETSLVYKQEYKRQLKAIKQQLLQEKDQKREERRQKDTAGRALVLQQQEKDQRWGLEHENDTDEQLLAYVQQAAEKLGHTPLSKEVPGATYIAKRIGSWALVLHLAGLPLPKGVEPPNPKTLKAYLQRKHTDNEST